MSRDSDYRRQMGMDMPIPSRDMATERFSITHKSHVEPEKPKLNFRFLAGNMEVNDGTGWRFATAEEIEDLMGGIASWPDREEGELGRAALRNGPIS